MLYQLLRLFGMKSAIVCSHCNAVLYMNVFNYSCDWKCEMKTHGGMMVNLTHIFNFATGWRLNNSYCSTSG